MFNDGGGGDRDSLDLPGTQMSLLAKVLATKTAPVVVVLVNGRPVRVVLRLYACVRARVCACVRAFTHLLMWWPIGWRNALMRRRAVLLSIALHVYVDRMHGSIADRCTGW